MRDGALLATAFGSGFFGSLVSLVSLVSFSSFLPEAAFPRVARARRAAATSVSFASAVSSFLPTVEKKRGLFFLATGASSATGETSDVGTLITVSSV